ncbi:hypothetical protein BHE74_00043287 [Ensete ventricosum]|nr:hypothetical protein GW17_00053229 [Ensete ventricosum]RWW50449.1 hypothetical protein BHE74_00043287 [Ensete ventricosum]
MVPPKWTVDGRFQSSAIDFDRRRSIEGEKAKKNKRKRRKKKKRTTFPRAVLACAPSPPTRRPLPRVARAPSLPTRRHRFFSYVRFHLLARERRSRRRR